MGIFGESNEPIEIKFPARVTYHHGESNTERPSEHGLGIIIDPATNAAKTSLGDINPTGLGNYNSYYIYNAGTAADICKAFSSSDKRKVDTTLEIDIQSVSVSHIDKSFFKGIDHLMADKLVVSESQLSAFRQELLELASKEPPMKVQMVDNFGNKITLTSEYIKTHIQLGGRAGSGSNMPMLGEFVIGKDGQLKLDDNLGTNQVNFELGKDAAKTINSLAQDGFIKRVDVSGMPLTPEVHDSLGYAGTLSPEFIKELKPGVELVVSKEQCETMREQLQDAIQRGVGVRINIDGILFPAPIPPRDHSASVTPTTPEQPFYAVKMPSPTSKEPDHSVKMPSSSYRKDPGFTEIPDPIGGVPKPTHRFEPAPIAYEPSPPLNTGTGASEPTPPIKPNLDGLVSPATLAEAQRILNNTDLALETSTKSLKENIPNEIMVASNSVNKATEGRSGGSIA